MKKLTKDEISGLNIVTPEYITKSETPLRHEDRKLEIYPPHQECLYNLYEKPPFYVEFSTWDGKNWEYRIFKRNYITSEEVYEENKDSDPTLEYRTEGHPYQLMQGKLIKEGSGIVWLETREYLTYLIDALNEKHANDIVNKIGENWRNNIKPKVETHDYMDDEFPEIHSSIWHVTSPHDIN